MQAEAEQEVTRRLHIGFFARSRDEVDEFWRAGTAAGYRDDGEPGERPQYSADYYGGFLRDPDDNSIEAVHLSPGRERGAIDHIWIRVPDLAAARSVYQPLAPRLGVERTWTHDDPPRAGFASPSGSFSLVVDGPPTQSLDVEFARQG
jgi:catechol 2,3-dioxygenase-like lactoylglutathione lyase family enzyme